MARPYSDTPKAAVIVACGGIGARFQGNSTNMSSTSGNADMQTFSQTKQFLPLVGRPVLAHTLAGLERHPRVGPVVLVLPEQLLTLGDALVNGRWAACSEERFLKVSIITAGGQNRQDSVANGLSALADSGWDGPVLVHDGVRPYTPEKVFDRVIDGVLIHGNAIAAIPVRDTLKRVRNGIVSETIDRRDLWQTQTPQGFRIHELIDAYNEARHTGLLFTDDASLFEATGRPVYLVEGDPANIKLTYPEDLIVLEALFAAL